MYTCIYVRICNYVCYSSDPFTKSDQSMLKEDHDYFYTCIKPWKVVEPIHVDNTVLTLERGLNRTGEYVYLKI